MEVTNQYNDRLIYGKNPDPFLVSMYMLFGEGGEYEKMRCLYRIDGRIEEVDHDFYPFCYVSSAGLKLIQTRMTSLNCKQLTLNGKGYYNNLIWFNRYKDYQTLTKTIRAVAEKETHKYLKTVGNVETQFLMQTGRTMFKGMRSPDLHVLAFDIETYTEGFFPNANRPEDKITVITAKDNRGGSWVFHTARDGKWTGTKHEGNPIEFKHGIFCESEEEMLNRFKDLVIQLDPDVIEGHNIFKFDLPYIAKRMDLYGIKSQLGRDGWSTLRFWSAQFKAADKSYAYHATSIRGRHIFDTYFAAMTEDVFRRDMDSYGLKYLAKYYKIVSEEREYVPGDQIPVIWREDPMRILRYALNDVEETLALGDKLCQASFYMSQMMPMPFEKVARAGQGTKIESVFLREYFEQRQSLPKPEQGKQDDGGYSELLHRGVFGPILYADVESLYPSIMLNYNVKPESEKLGIFQPALRVLTDLRFEWKAKMKSYEKNTPEYTQYEGQQNAAKIVLNSFYGNLSSPVFLFNDYSEGQRVALTGQKILKQIINLIHSDGGIVLECDTDGVMCLPPPHIKLGDKSSEMAYINSLSGRTPKGIVVGHDGTYHRMVSYKTKNYVLRETPDSEPKYKGSGLKSRGNEKFVNRFVRTAFRLMLDEDVAAIRDLYLEYRQKIVQKKFDISEFSATKTLKKTLKEYKAGVKISGLRYPQYEIGLQLAEKGMPIEPGDRISYYVANVEGDRVWEKAKWDGNYSGDEDIHYYLDRLDAAMEKIKPMFKSEDWNRIQEVNTGIFPFEVKQIFIPQVNVITGESIGFPTKGGKQINESHEDKCTTTNGECKGADEGEPGRGGLGSIFDGTEDDRAELTSAYIDGYICGADYFS